jgi:cytochrome c5
MSEVHVEDHSTPIRTSQQLIVVVLLAFLVPIVLIVMMVQMVTGGLRVDTGSRSMSEDAVAQRLKPVGDVALAEATPTKGARSGEEVVQTVCQACHGPGLLGAPKIGDTQAWKARIAQGEKTLTAHVINGIRAMPARGGGADLTDSELERAVIWMANQSGASFTQAAAGATQPAGAASPTPAAGRAAPAGAVSSTPAAKTGVSAGKPDGSKVYQTACVTCHGAGLMGAPKLGDKAAWKPRLAQGLSTLQEHAIKGIRAMPAKGANPSLSDPEVSAAVDYMLSQSK